MENLKKFEGKETKHNIREAMKSEGLAQIRYKMLAEIAEDLDVLPLEKLFKEIKGNEKEHSDVLHDLLYGPGHKATLDNLLFTVALEHQEGNVTYVKYAEKAREEGFADVAEKFEMLASVEKHHAKIIEQMVEEAKSGRLFKRGVPIDWHCLECGYRVYAKEAPKKCPLCGHIGSYEPMV